MKKYKAIIGTSFAFCAINSFAVCIHSWMRDVPQGKSSFFLGILMAIMIPISAIDPRKQMGSRKAAGIYIAMLVLVSGIIAVLFSACWLAFLLLPELAVLVAWYFLW